MTLKTEVKVSSETGMSESGDGRCDRATWLTPSGDSFSSSKYPKPRSLLVNLQVSRHLRGPSDVVRTEGPQADEIDLPRGDSANSEIGKNFFLN